MGGSSSGFPTWTGVERDEAERALFTSRRRRRCIPGSDVGLPDLIITRTSWTYQSDPHIEVLRPVKRGHVTR